MGFNYNYTFLVKCRGAKERERKGTSQAKDLKKKKKTILSPGPQDDTAREETNGRCDSIERSHEDQGWEMWRKVFSAGVWALLSLAGAGRQEDTGRHKRHSPLAGTANYREVMSRMGAQGPTELRPPLSWRILLALHPPAVFGLPLSTSPVTRPLLPVAPSTRPPKL